MGASSRAKGARGELEACEALGRISLDCRRVPQYANRNGGHKSPDVVCDSADIWFEVKRSEHLSPYRYMDQALSDSQGKRPAVVVMRSSHRPWLVMMRLDDLPRVLEEVARASSLRPASQGSDQATGA